MNSATDPTGPGAGDDRPYAETYSPWTVVNLVFGHLADEGLHPTLGSAGNPGEPAAELLRALGIRPSQEGDARVGAATREKLAEMRETMSEDNAPPRPPVQN